MVKAKQDKFILGESSSPKVMPTGGMPIRVDVGLTPKTDAAIGVSIEGIVYDTSSPPKPIVEAVVKVADSTFNPISYCKTDSLGKYLFNLPLTAGTYNVLATAKGKKLSPPQTITIVVGENKVVPNIILETDPAAQLGVIEGEVDDTSGKGIAGAVVSLYDTSANPPVLAEIAYTNSYGLYTLREVKNGKYSLKFSALGYISKSTDNININGAEGIITSNAALNIDVNASNGTISGMVKGNDNLPINRGDVILYRVETSGAVPIAYTKTNDKGVYLFMNVPSGSYRVLSSELQPVEVIVDGPDGPNISRVTIAKRGMKYNILYPMKDAKLSGSSSIDSTLPNFIKNLGGIGAGKAEFTLDVPNGGDYVLYTRYLSPTIAKKISVYVDNKLFTQQLLAATAGALDANAINAAYEINLTKGQHIVRYEGVGVEDTPWIGDIMLQYRGKTYDFPQGTGTIAAPAVKDATTGYVKGVGGALDGSYTVTFDVERKFTGNYILLVRYLTAEGDKKLRFNVNGTITDYTCTKTATNNVADFKWANIDIVLKEGTNTIKLQGDGTDAPMLGHIRLLVKSNETIIEGKNTVLTGSASELNGFIKGIGGKGDGAMNLEYLANMDGVYDICINYVADINKKLEIITNDFNSGPIIFDATAGVLATNARDKIIPINLYQGTNKIRLQR